jgi:hypothetical protein
VLLASGTCVTACGGASHDRASTSNASRAEPGATTGASPTKAQYIAKSDRICRAGHEKGRIVLEKAQALRARATGKLTPAIRREVVALLRQEISSAHAEQAMRQRLPEPSGETKIIQRLRSLSEEGLADASRIATAIANNEAELAAATLEEDKTISALDQKLSRQFGFKVCGTLIGA